MGTRLKVRALLAGEMERCRTLRLCALQDAPDAFGEKYEVAVDRPDRYWEKLTESLTPPAKQRMFLAGNDDVYCGFVFAMLDRKDQMAGRVGGMWVDSRFRNQGIGQMLLNAVFEWANAHHFFRLRLWCEEGDTPAHRLYVRAGFRDTEKRNTLRDKVNKDLVEMMWFAERG